MFRDYEHHASYYETDQMGCVYHSNFICWMEEAQIDMMEQMDCRYRSAEEAGIMSPVLEISCRYRTMVHLNDHILIRVRMRAYNAIRMILSYEIQDKAIGELRATSESSHCFLNREKHPASPKRTYPTWDKAFQKAMTTRNT